MMKDNVCVFNNGLAIALAMYISSLMLPILGYYPIGCMYVFGFMHFNGRIWWIMPS